MSADHVDKCDSARTISLGSQKQFLLQAVVQQHVAPDKVRSHRQSNRIRSASPIEADDHFDGSLGPRIEQVQVLGKVGRVSLVHPNEMGQKRIKIAGVCNSA